MKTLIALAGLLTFAGTAFATTNLDLTTHHPLEAKYTAWLSANGTIESVDRENNIIEIRNDDGTVRRFALDPNARVSNANEPSDLDRVAVGEYVKIHYTRTDGTVTSIVTNDADNATAYEPDMYDAPLTYSPSY